MSKFTFARPVPKKSAELDKNVDDAAGDLDGEGVSNLDEFLSGTDPNLADTDGDGLSDGTEGMAPFFSRRSIPHLCLAVQYVACTGTQ